MQNSERSTVARMPERGRYDRDTVFAILDEAPICTVSFTVDGQPFAIPMLHARMDDTIYLHGSNVSRLLTTLEQGAKVCIVATLLDGIVLARSMFHSSMNYRSVVLFGDARAVDDREEKMAAMRAVSEHVSPGRWDEVRQPSPKEIAGTKIVAVPISEASAKIRTGPPIDDEGDVDDIWTGVIPLSVVAREPISVYPDLATPDSVAALRKTYSL